MTNEPIQHTGYYRNSGQLRMSCEDQLVDYNCKRHPIEHLNHGNPAKFGTNQLIRNYDIWALFQHEF